MRAALASICISVLLPLSLAHGKAVTKTSSAVANTATPFELCFANRHGRCFRTSEAGMFRQYGGMSDSEAFLPETEQRRLFKDISAFFTKVGYAKAKMVKSCSNPFVFREMKEATAEIRCLERLKKADSEKLLSLITQVSLASKPL